MRNIARVVPSQHEDVQCHTVVLCWVQQKEAPLPGSRFGRGNNNSVVTLSRRRLEVWNEYRTHDYG
jgi:hypothetical protein